MDEIDAVFIDSYEKDLWEVGLRRLLKDTNRTVSNSKTLIE